MKKKELKVVGGRKNTMNHGFNQTRLKKKVESGVCL